MGFIKKLGKKIKSKMRIFLGIHSQKNSSEFIQELRDAGCSIGERVVVFNPASCVIDVQYAHMIEIGNDVQIPFGVAILTHGYDWSVLKGLYGDVLGSAGKVKIGNNVFIGARSTILKGVTIGDNVIIGACSLVNKDIPSNCVATGNPCKVIMTIEEYYEKRKKAQFEEATQVVRLYREKYGKNPPPNVLSEFFFLFTNKVESLDESMQKQLHNLGNYEQSVSKLVEHKPMFSTMEDFFDSIE